MDKVIVQLDMQHWRMDDLEISLWRLSDSRQVILYNSSGCTDDPFYDRIQFTFDGDAAYYPGSVPGDWPCRGDSFLPRENLSSFSGVTGDGQWNLRIKDLYSSCCVGTLYAWCLSV